MDKGKPTTCIHNSDELGHVGSQTEDLPNLTSLGGFQPKVGLD